MIQHPWKCWGNSQWQKPLKEQPPLDRIKYFQRPKPRFLIRHLGYCYTKTHHCKGHMHPNTHCTATSKNQNTDPRKCSPRGLSVQEMWYIYTMGYYSDKKNHHWTYEIMTLVPKRLDLGGLYKMWTQQQRKKKQMMSLLGIILKRCMGSN